MLWYILGAVIWIAIAFWPARVAARKGHSFFLYFLFSLVFFPLALLVAYMVSDRRLLRPDETVRPWWRGGARQSRRTHVTARRRVTSVVRSRGGVAHGPRTTVTCSPSGHSLTNSSRPSTWSATRTVVSVRSIGRTTLAST